MSRFHHHPSSRPNPLGRLAANIANTSRDQSVSGSKPALNQIAVAPFAKRDTLKLVREISRELGLGPAPIQTLYVLLTFLPGKCLVDDAGRPGIVFASNRSIAKRAGGIGEATVRTHISLLVSAGLFERKTERNHKRGRTRDAAGTVSGYDGLSVEPLIRRHDEFKRILEAQTRRLQGVDEARCKLKVEVRRLGEKLAGLIEIGWGQAADFEIQRTSIGRTLRHVEEPGKLAALSRRFDILTVELDLELSASTLDSSVVDAQNERQVRSSRRESQTELNWERTADDKDKRVPIGFGLRLTAGKKVVVPRIPANCATSYKPGPPMRTIDEVRPATPSPLNAEEARPANDSRLDTGANRDNEPLSSAESCRNIEWQAVLARCAALKDYTAKGEITTANEFNASVDVVQRTFAIRSSDWHAFVGEFGHDLAALAVAYMLENFHRTRNPGGYFRRLLSLARDGKFSASKILLAMANATAKGKKL